MHYQFLWRSLYGTIPFFLFLILGQSYVKADITAETTLEALTRGAIHEGFAEQIQLKASESITIQTEPPAAARELPPEYMPRTYPLVWMPGYWDWDHDRNDYIWVSGCWRRLPPDHRWVPGYWHKSDKGYHRISGMWVSAKMKQLEFRTTPPEEMEFGPTSEAPSKTHFWVPGYHHYKDGRYEWKKGYWARSNSDWIWIPARNITTVRGTIFIEGHWDYRLHRRGVLFAPVFLTPEMRASATFVVTPKIVVPVHQIILHLFVNPSRGHYMFGNYYGEAALQQGYIPWAHYSKTNFDAHFTAYAAIYQHQGIDLAERLNGWHAYYIKHEALRPPLTFDAQTKFATDLKGEKYLAHSLLGTYLENFIAGRVISEGFIRLSMDTRVKFGEAAAAVVKLGLDLSTATELLLPLPEIPFITTTGEPVDLPIPDLVPGLPPLIPGLPIPGPLPVL